MYVPPIAAPAIIALVIPAVTSPATTKVAKPAVNKMSMLFEVFMVSILICLRF